MASRAWVVWAVGVGAYILTAMQRTTFGVAGLDAADRFSVSPGALSAFVFIQVAVYIAAQIPAGLLVDRWGARLMLAVSGALLVAGQLLLAVAPGLPLAVAARVLVGAGDAVVFVAVLALVPRWLPARRVPVLTQVTTILGQLGQILSAVPFLALLQSTGWSTAFGAAAAGSALAAVLALAVVRNAPGRQWSPGVAMSARDVGRQLRACGRGPALGLASSGTWAPSSRWMVFSLLWGVPYLVSAQGLSVKAAGLLVSFLVVCTIGIGPVVGVLTTRHPLRRPG